MAQKVFKIGLLTCEKLPLLTTADQRIQQMLNESGFVAEALIWDDKSVDWKQYDALIFRNTWDYFEKEESFMRWLLMIENNGIKTLNPIDVIRKNIHKFYLRDLEVKGIKIIPTIFIEKNTKVDLSKIVGDRWNKIVIKPAFSAGAYLTTLTDSTQFDSISVQYNEICKSKDLMIQAFIPEVATNGETSLLYFNNAFSHAVRKVPADGDFRVQSHFGGQYQAVDIDESIKDQAQKALKAFGYEDVLYARVDGIIIDGIFHLMEIEMIEPDLYLDHHELAFEQFTNAIIATFQKANQ